MKTSEEIIRIIEDRIEDYKAYCESVADVPDVLLAQKTALSELHLLLDLINDENV